MALQHADFERAVENLLSPSHYEFLLYWKQQSGCNKRLLKQRGHKSVADVMRIVHAGNVRVPTFDADEAIDVMAEALRRLR